MNPIHKLNGLPLAPGLHGGDDNFTSVSYMPIPNAVMQTLATLIFDGVFDRFPRLKCGAIELGAHWGAGLDARDGFARACVHAQRGAAAHAVGTAQRDRARAVARDTLSA